MAPGRLNYTHEDYLNLFIIYGECNKVLSRTCDVFANKCSEKQEPSTNNFKQKFEILRIFALLKEKLKIFK